ncbi:MAG: VWA domain-containing protein [Sedimentisphaerales bacterium]|nr:VWA domain-containing protein [Sedimentisphaerales bacterium]
MFGSIIFDPVISMPLIFGIGMVMTILIIIYYFIGAKGTGRFRRLLLAFIRLCALFVMIVILARPMMQKPQEQTSQKPVICVMTDSSESMNTKDINRQSRYETMKKILTEDKDNLLKNLQSNYDLRFFGFDEDLRRISLQQIASANRAEGKDTHITESLMKLIEDNSDKKLRSVLLISDGRTNEIDSLAAAQNIGRYLRSMNVPVWTVPLGTSIEPKDVYITAKLSSNFIFVEQPASIQVSLTGVGFSESYAKVNLYREDKYVTSEQVQIRNGRAEVSFPVREEIKGIIQYKVEVEPLEDESDIYNNKRTVIAKVTDEKTKVLVVEADPHWDSKFLLRALRADTNIEVTSVFQMNRFKTFAIVESISENDLFRKTVTPGARMPKTKEELFKYDCIFFGKDIEMAFTIEELKLLKAYLTEREGSIVFFRGKPYSDISPELAGIEPVEWGYDSLHDVRFELTEQGRLNPIFNFQTSDRSSDIIIRELPSMISATRVVNQKSLAVVLAKLQTSEPGGEIATVAYQRYGKGKVMSIGSSGLWQWGFLPTELQQYDDIYDQFWGQMIRWLVSDSDFLPGQNISFVINSSSFKPGETVTMGVYVKQIDHSQYKPYVELTVPDGNSITLSLQSQQDNPNIYMAHYTPEEQGEYKAVLHNNIGEPDKETARFTVYYDSLETRYVSADRDFLDQISYATGGESLELAELGSLPGKLKLFESLLCERTKPEDVWDRLPVFSALVCLLGIEWLIRRASGLL